MAKMLAAAHGCNQEERPECCFDDDKFRRSGKGKRFRNRRPVR